MVRRLVGFFIVSVGANAQWLAVGVTGAVPISPHSMTSESANIRLNPSGSIPINTVIVQAPNDFYQKPYAFGPTVEVNLRWNLSFETGMLYERFHRDVSEGLTVFKGGGANFGFITSVAANAFSFPLVVKYNVGHRRLKPFIEAGATLRHLGVFEGQGLQLDDAFRPSQASFRFDPNKSIEVAITAGGGLRFHTGALDLVPQIRYLHWTNHYHQPVQDQAMLALTATFPARR